MLTAAKLRSGKSQFISLLIMSVIAAILLNLGLLTLFEYQKAFDDRAQELNSADVIFLLQTSGSVSPQELEGNMKSDPRTQALESRDILYLPGSCIFGQGETSRKYAILRDEDKGEIGKISYVEKLEPPVKNPIYLPYLFKTGGGYTLGDSFQLKILLPTGDEKFSYTVAGFFEESFLATINSNSTGLILDSAGYEQLALLNGGALNGTMLSAKLKDTAEGEKYCAAHMPSQAMSQSLEDGIYYEFIRQSRTITSSIASMIVVAFSMIISIIALIVVRFRIVNTIEEDMKNIGALKAMGYLNRQISGAILMQFLSVAGLGAIMGIGLSYSLLPLLAEMFAAQTGVLWEPGFNLLSSLITLLILLTAVAGVSAASSLRLRALSPIIALRNGIATHSFRRNPLPLDKSALPLPLSLACKSFLLDIKRNLLIAVIVAAMGFTAAFAGVMYYNMSAKPDNFIVNCIGELYDVQLDLASTAKEEEFISEINKMPQVRKAYAMTTRILQVEGSLQATGYITEDFAMYDRQETVYMGRFPEYGNETAIGGLLAGELNKNIGDTIILGEGDNKEEYLITGLIQGSNFMGRDLALIHRGYLRISPDFKPSSLVLYLNSGIDADSFMESLKAKYKEDILAIYNSREIIYASLGSYQGIAGILVIVVAITVAAVILLTLYLVIKTSLIRKKQALGIQKAIGYTTAQLVLETALSFFPVVILGSLTGCTAGFFAINPILSILFSGIGMMRVNFEILPAMLILITAAMSLFGFLICLLVSARIRKISPYSLISE